MIACAFARRLVFARRLFRDRPPLGDPRRDPDQPFDPAGRGETLLIECFDLRRHHVAPAPDPQGRRAGASPLVETEGHAASSASWSGTAPRPDAAPGASSSGIGWSGCKAYIGLRGARNINEMADVPAEKMDLYNTHLSKPVHFEYRIKQDTWCVLRLPNASMAQQAGMSTEAFEDFYFDVCNLDYARLARALEPLVERMEAAKRGPHHRARDRPAVLDRGHSGRPLRGGDEHPRWRGLHGARARLGRGARPVQHADGLPGCARSTASGSNSGGAGSSRPTAPAATPRSSGGSSTTDEGASYVGEWSIGCNPRILHPMRDILFDEKIAGSFHLTPGNAYDEADNGNRSKIHWDLVQIQRPDYGGGTIAFDGVPIRERRPVRPRRSPSPRRRPRA